MKIALINPKGALFSRNAALAEAMAKSDTMRSFRYFWSAPNLGLLTIASYIPPSWSVTYIDENYRGLDFNEWYDLVLLSAMTVQVTRAYEIAVHYRQKGSLTVLGGIHATVLPEEALQHVDVVIAGEGEELFPQFLKDLQNGDVKPLYRSSQKGTFSLLQCKIPRYELIQGYPYPLVNLYTTRGCPHSCSFCCASNVYGRNYRQKAIPQIITEIQTIQRVYPDTLLLFADDNAFVLRKQAKELLRQLKGRGLRWIAQTDISAAEDEELLTLMRQAGCQWVVIGFESIQANSLRRLNATSYKARNVSSYPEKIQAIQSHGIGIYGTFIVGLDEDDLSVFSQTVDFILQNRLYGANITVPTPLPRTQLRQQLQAENRIRSNTWEDYTLWDVVMEPKRMSAVELEEGLISIYRALMDPQNAAARLAALLHTVRKERHNDTKRNLSNC